jgi:hypothetical protein
VRKWDTFSGYDPTVKWSFQESSSISRAFARESEGAS